VEPERPQHRAHHERRESVVVDDRSDRGRDRGPVPCRASQGGAGAAQVVGALGADADQHHEAEVGVVRAAERHRHAGDLAGLAGRPVQLEHAEQVEAELVAQLRATGAEDDRVVRARTGKHRDRSDLHAANGVRQGRGQRELRRRDLGRKGRVGVLWHVSRRRP